PESIRTRFPIRRPPAERSLMIRLDLTNNCNLACRQCTLRQSRKASGEPAGEMDFELFERLTEQVFPYAASVALSCEAEPLLHSRFADIMRLVALNPGPLYKITTNGQLLDEEKARLLLTSRVGEIYISIDGATPATYENIRQRGSFARLEESLRLLNRLKAEQGAGRHDAPLLQVNYTLMTSTLHELPQMVEWCREWNVDRLVVQHLYGLEVNGMQNESLSASPDESDAVLKACQEQCTAHGIRTFFPRPFNPVKSSECEPRRSPPSSPATLDCHAPWRLVRVRWNGDVYPCDLWQPPGFGNLGNQSFLDIWNSTPYLRLRWGHARRQARHPNCRGCSMVTTENIEGRDIQAPVAFVPSEERNRP
ncbi:MAG: radical SAM protein, partial [bacterium]